ncbi:MBL fold metallo-hydrolase [Patescibacteria group bacterium]
MQLTFLGTGPSLALPRKGHADALCKSARKVGSKDKRTRSSALITHKQKNILIDCGPDFLEQIKREYITKIDAILLTHAHRDAAGGFNQLRIWLNNHSEKIPIYIERRTWQTLKTRFKRLDHLKPIFISAGKNFKLLDLNVKPFRVHHSLQKEFPTLGYRFGNKLVYASDFWKVPYKSKENMYKADVLMIDAAIYFGLYIHGHQNTEQALKMAHALRAGQTYLTQVGHSYPPHVRAQQDIRRAWMAMGEQAKSMPKIAYDGLKIKL